MSFPFDRDTPTSPSRSLVASGSRSKSKTDVNQLSNLGESKPRDDVPTCGRPLTRTVAKAQLHPLFYPAFGPFSRDEPLTRSNAGSRNEREK